MLQTLSHYAYFFLASVFAALVFLGYFYSGAITYDTNIVFLYTVVLIPLFDKMIDFFAKESVFQVTVSPDAHLELAKWWLIAIIVLVWLYIWMSPITLGMLVLFVSSLLWNIDPRMSFAGALILFLYIPVYLFIWQTDTAEALSIFAYYFLIIGVVLQIYQSLVTAKKRSWNTQ